MNAERNNLDLSVLILEKLIDLELIPCDPSGEYSDTEWEIQDTIREILDTYLPNNQ
jgi:hypothetical protein